MGRRKKIVRIKLLIVLILGASLLNADKLGNVPDIYKPRCMGVYKNNLYVSDQGSIFIFGLDNLKFKHRFVRKGQGPSEFSNSPLFKFHQDEVLVHGSFKVARFDLNGKFISENTAKFYFFDIGIAGDNYVLKRTDYDSAERVHPIYYIGVFDKNYLRVKDLARTKRIIKRDGKKRIFPLINPVNKFLTYKNKIYMVAAENDFLVKVFNSKGELKKNICHEYKRIKISDEFKTRRIDFIKNLVGPKRWPSFRKGRTFTFPEEFPAIKDFLITEGRIYVNTYLEKNGKEEFWVLTLDGKLLRKIFLPPARELFRSIWSGHFYYLIENEDEEEWELHAVALEN